MRKLSVEEQRQIYISLLDYFHNYCIDNNLRYYLAFGTLLGAIRHHGFIPWDDDVDIIMPREDYERLLTCYDNNASRFKIYHYSNNDTIKSRMIYLIDTATIRKSSYAEEFIENLGMNIDIFPLDNTPDDIVMRNLHLLSVKVLDTIFNIKSIPISPYRSKFKNVCIKLLQSMLSPVGYKRLVTELDRVASNYKGRDTIFCNAFYSPYRQSKPYRTDAFKESVGIEFESRYYMAPKGYDSILRTTYGDYMKLPPKAKRLPHNDHMEYYVVEERL